MKKTILKFSVLALSLIVVAGCTNPFAKKTKPTEETPNSLLNNLEKQSELHTFSSAQEMKDFFANHQNNQSSSVGAIRTDNAGVAEMAKDQAAPQATGLGGGSGYSTTNVQVAGVDEADLVKTDGSYIYTVSDKNIAIISAVPADKAKLVSTISLSGRPQEIYLDQDKLVVFGYEEDVLLSPLSSIRPYSPSSFLSVYDISDKASPKILKSLKFEGSYNSSRLIDSRVYFITTNYSFYPTDEVLLPAVYENGEKISGDQSNDRYIFPKVHYVETPAAYSATSVSVIDLAKLDQALLSEVYFMPAGQAIYASRGNLYLTYTKYISEYDLRMAVAKELMFNRLPEKDKNLINQISGIDKAILSDDEKSAKINQIIESYIAHLSENDQKSIFEELNNEFQKRYDALYKQMETTVIHKIALNEGQLSYQGFGEVSGHLLNQFSMDEDKGYFRVATTRSQSWIMPFPIFSAKIAANTENTKDSYNNVFVLDENMKTVGTLENLAGGERIYSTRFIGDRAYVVTFKQTDPLFALDLSEPTNPKVLGQVKLPGFSSYLHPYNENVLIGIGKEAVDKGSQGVEVGGLKVSLFDVSDPANPKEITNLNIGGKGSDASVLYDHKALLFSEDKQILSFPVNLTKEGSNNYQLDFQGAIVLDIKADSLKLKGKIYQPTSTERKNSGFGDYESIQRILYIGDNFYSISSAAVQINKIDNLEKLNSIALPVSTNNIEPGKPMPLSSPATRAIE